ncbi:MAG: hypothetical protein WBG63_21010, partial [Phormidesmis sp.]
SNEPLASSPDSAPDSALQTVVSISAQQSPFPVKTVAIAIAALILGVASLISVQPKLSPKLSTKQTAEPTIEQASEPTETAKIAAIDAANSSAISSQQDIPEDPETAAEFRQRATRLISAGQTATGISRYSISPID